MRTFAAWLQYIESLHPKTMAMGLERIQPIAAQLGVERFTCPVITIGGTNGKGSCVAFLESIYRAQGYLTGAYTSPHLLHFSERVRIQGQEVSDSHWQEAFGHVEAARGETPLTFFEFTTLAALWLFQGQDLDVILLEVGLGGRLDAVNLVDSDVAIITTIALDHQEWLGDSREAIGREKAGIFRAHKAAICGDPDPPQSVLDIAAAKGAVFYGMETGSGALFQRPAMHARTSGKEEKLSRSFAGQLTHEGRFWQWRYQDQSYSELPLPRLPWQNAVTALMAVHCLAPQLPVTRQAIDQGLQTACLPGRFQQVSHPVPGIYDVAHNPQSAELLAQRLSESPRPGKMRAVVSILGDKDIKSTLRPLLPLVDVWYVGGLDIPRGVKAAVMVEHLRDLGVGAYFQAETVPLAYEMALRDCEKEDHLLVFGSFHTVAAVLRL